MLIIAQDEVTLSNPAFANCFVVRSCLTLLLFYKSHLLQNLLVRRTFKIFFIIKNGDV